MDLTPSEFLIVCGSLILIAMLVSEILDWVQMIVPLTSNHHIFVPILDYIDDNRPQVSKAEGQSCELANKSPINIITRDSVVIEGGDPLKWIGYSIQPTAMTMINDGKTVSLEFIWPEEFLPHIEGGPLKKSYNFHSLRFYWGLSDDVGSEHAFDNFEYPMEMQLVHVKSDLESVYAKIDPGKTDDMAIISYFFNCSEKTNYTLESIVCNLSAVENGQSQISIIPFSIDTIFPQFNKHFYSYNSSMTELLFNDNKTWIIHPGPLNISKSQLDQFRKVQLSSGHKIRNSQIIQISQDQTVYFYE